MRTLAVIGLVTTTLALASGCGDGNSGSGGTAQGDEGGAGDSGGGEGNIAAPGGSCSGIETACTSSGEGMVRCNSGTFGSEEPCNEGYVCAIHPARISAKLNKSICQLTVNYISCGFELALSGAITVDTVFDLGAENSGGDCASGRELIVVSSVADDVRVGIRFAETLDTVPEVGAKLPVTVLVAQGAGAGPTGIGDLAGDWETAAGDCIATITSNLPWGHDPTSFDSGIKHGLSADVTCDTGVATAPEGGSAEGTVMVEALKIRGDEL